jgi:cell division protein FtsA
MSNANTNPVIVGLDIGTTKIAAIAGRKNEFGKLEIVSFGRASSNNAVQQGQVLNIEQAVLAINEAISNCKLANPAVEINEVYVGIAGQHIKSLQTRGDLVRQNLDDEITQSEINQLIADQRKTYIPAGDQIIDVIPQEFTVDNYQNIINPIGFSGVKVGANFHIITGDKYAIRNITRAVNKSNLAIKDLVLQPLASSDAVMCEQDLEAGVAILDIGGGTSDLAIFHEGVLKHTAVIPFGGENITNDIKMGLGVIKAQAEAMKVQFGSALAKETKSNAYITIPGLRGIPAKQIQVKILAEIIQARMSEILDFVVYHFKQVGVDHKKLNGGIIITGGGSQLKHLTQLTEYHTGLNVRIGYPNENLAGNYIEELMKPAYSTCIGLILKGYRDYEKTNKLYTGQNINTQQQVQQPTNVSFGSETNNAGGVQGITDTNMRKEQLDKNIAQIKQKKSIWDKLKGHVYDLFKEEDDKELN